LKNMLQINTTDEILPKIKENFMNSIGMKVKNEVI
jgi:hypothetical protein